MPDKSLFPRTGYIVDGVAAGFVYFTDSAVAIIDCYISNPASDPDARSDALDAITRALLATAKFHKCSLVKCDTHLEAIKRRAVAHGFKAGAQYVSFSMRI